MTPSYRALGAAVTIASICAASGQITVNWGAGTINSDFFRASGAAFTTSEYDDIVFELGVFDSGFETPSLANADQWRANWTSLGQTTNTASDEPRLRSQYNGRTIFGNPETNPDLIGTDDRAVAPSPLASNQKLFVWAYFQGEGDYMIGDAPVEYLLYSNDNSAGGDSVTNDNWITPPTDDPTIQSHSLNSALLVVETANEEFVGQINLSSLAGEEGQVQFALVPEPSSILLSGFGILALLRRRRA